MLDSFPDSTTEALLRLAGEPKQDLARVIGEITLDRAVASLVEEVADRCAPPRNVTAAVLFEVHHGADSVEYTFSCIDGKLELDRGHRGDSGARIRFEATDLLAALYGPAGRSGGVTRQVESLLRPPGEDPHDNLVALFGTAMPPHVEVIQAVLSACSTTPPDLGDLAVRFGSDKWGLLHWYTSHYDRHFRRLADEPVRLLELGVGGYSDPASGGESLRMWQRYFRRGVIHGIDIYDKSGISGPRMRTLVGNQNDVGFLRELAGRIGPLDIIIDDGSHINQHVRTSFDALFPHLRGGGIYVIEDLETSYWPGYGGSAPGEGNGGSTMDKVKELLDALHYPDYRDTSTYSPSTTERHIAGIHCYRNIVFVEKGLNAEGELPGWIPRAPL